MAPPVGERTLVFVSGAIREHYQFQSSEMGALLEALAQAVAVLGQSLRLSSLTVGTERYRDQVPAGEARWETIPATQLDAIQLTALCAAGRGLSSIGPAVGLAVRLPWPATSRTDDVTALVDGHLAGLGLSPAPALSDGPSCWAQASGAGGSLAIHLLDAHQARLEWGLDATFYAPDLDPRPATEVSVGATLGTLRARSALALAEWRGALASAGWRRRG